MNRTQRPDKTVKILDINGNEREINLREIGGTRVQVNGTNTYFIEISGEEVQVTVETFANLQADANGYTFLKHRL